MESETLSTVVNHRDGRVAVEMAREATKERHRRLEELPSQERLLQDDYRPSEYRWLLQRLYGFYKPLGAALAANIAWGPRIAERVSLLARDLSDLGLSALDLRELSCCRELPTLDTPDRILGCLYVIEGATLGGRVIAKHLDRAFGRDARMPVRFFAGDGARTKDVWNRSCAAMNAEASNFEELCASACATFDAMAGWLESPLTLANATR